MTHLYSTSLFIFRRDLRLEDNKGLLRALESSKKVIACFIIAPEQVGSSNKYRSMRSIQYMAQSLENLALALEEQGGKLFFFYGDPTEVLTRLFTKLSISAVFSNRDYTPYSIRRDENLAQLCAHYSIPFIQEDDVLLISPEEGLSKQGKPYELFTPFFRKNSLSIIQEPQATLPSNYATPLIEEAISLEAAYSLLVPEPLHSYVQGGRSSSLKLLNSLNAFRDYAVTRDFPERDTTLLSAALKYGTLSVREVYHTITAVLGVDHPLIRQLFWRDFFYHIAFFSPSVFGHAFHKEYDDLSWNNDYRLFERWCEGTTGFPLVDAGMRQLAATGFMHNRARLITGSFLVKDMHCDWRWGEQYFAQQLTDYDPCVNNGNWQWVASTGCDRQPYFRIFNPWLQQKKFDPDCTYIKRWIPELQNVPAYEIHHWFKQKRSLNGYPVALLDHTEESLRTKQRYKTIFQRNIL